MQTLRFDTRSFLWFVHRHCEVAKPRRVGEAIVRIGDNGMPATAKDAQQIACWLRRHADALDKAAAKAEQKGGA